MRGAFWRCAMFSAVGAIGLGVQLALLALFVNVLGIHYLLATALAVEAAVLHNFAWHCRWTWADRPRADASSVTTALLRFHVSNGLVSIAGNLLLMRLFVELMAIDPVVAGLLSLPPCALINFLLSDRWVFPLTCSLGTDRAVPKAGGASELC